MSNPATEKKPEESADNCSLAMIDQKIAALQQEIDALTKAKENISRVHRIARFLFHQKRAKPDWMAQKISGETTESILQLFETSNFFQQKEGYWILSKEGLKAVSEKP